MNHVLYPLQLAIVNEQCFTGDASELGFSQPQRTACNFQGGAVSSLKCYGKSEEHQELPMMFGAQTVSPAFPAVHACISVVHPSWFLAIVNTYDV